jgi:hypothetical protein
MTLVGAPTITLCSATGVATVCAADSLAGATLHDLCCAACAGSFPSSGGGDFEYVAPGTACADTDNLVVTALFGTTCSAAAGSGLCSSSAWAPLVCQQSCGRCPGRCGNDISLIIGLWGLLNPTYSVANLDRCVKVSCFLSLPLWVYAWGAVTLVCLPETQAQAQRQPDARDHQGPALLLGHCSRPRHGALGA